MRRILLCVFVMLPGCAAHRAGTWRLAGQVLIPPDVKRTDISRREFVPPVRMSKTCSGMVTAGRGRIVVTREELLEQPAGWLTRSASEWEAEGCVAAGEGAALARSVAESLPLDPAAAFRLLYGEERGATGMDLDGETRVQVVSPVLREARGPVVGVERNDKGLSLTAKASDNLLGYETSVYELEPRAGQGGYRIARVSRDRHSIAGAAAVAGVAKAGDALDFPEEAAYFRLFQESWRNDFSAVVMGAATRAELDGLTARFEAGGDAASCRDFKAGQCRQIPKDVAVNAFVEVEVNGKEMLVSRGSTLRQILRTAGVRDAVPAELVIEKRWRGRRVPVRWERGDEGVLGLPMEGGEAIRWR